MRQRESMKTNSEKKLITVTEEAAKHMKSNISKRGKPTEGIRIEVRGKGCSGMSYTMEFCEEAEDSDNIVEHGGLKIFIDPKSIIFLIGLEIDYKEDMFKSGFSFKNPNAKGSCGCGESFNV